MMKVSSATTAAALIVAAIVLFCHDASVVLSAAAAADSSAAAGTCEEGGEGDINGDCSSSGGGSTNTDHGQALMDWLHNDEGGFFHKNLEIRRTGPEGSPFYGMFATDDIPKDDLMIQIPRNFLVKPAGGYIVGNVVSQVFGDGQTHYGIITAINDDGTYNLHYDDQSTVSNVVEEGNFEIGTVECKTTEFLVREMKLGNKSHLAPYINYLNSQPKGQLPSAWSEPGQDLFLKVLGAEQPDDDDEEEEPVVGILPPYDPEPVGRVNEYYESCNNREDFHIHAYMLLLQRGWDDLMIPVFDMMSHGNGHWLNTKVPYSVHDENSPIVVQASRNIKMGEEIFTTYNFCEDCGARKLWYGTPELLRDYGFVERYPQRWVFPNQDAIFDIDLVRNEHTGEAIITDQNPEGQEVRLRWVKNHVLSPRHALFFVEQLERLEEIQNTDLKSKDPNIPQFEWETIVNYVYYLKKAMQMALDQSAPPPPKPPNNNNNNKAAAAASE